MHPLISTSRNLGAGFIVFLVLLSSAFAENPDGTYRLVMRTLVDGTVLRPPAVNGMGTFKNGVYQLTIFGAPPMGNQRRYRACQSGRGRKRKLPLRQWPS